MKKYTFVSLKAKIVLLIIILKIRNNVCDHIIKL